MFKITATKKTTVNLYIFQTGIAFPYPDSAINIYNAHVSFEKEWIGNIDMVLDKDQMPVSANLMYIMNPNFATIQVLNTYSGTPSYQYYYSHDMTQPLNTQFTLCMAMFLDQNPDENGLLIGNYSVKITNNDLPANFYPCTFEIPFTGVFTYPEWFVGNCEREETGNNENNNNQDNNNNVDD